MRTNGTYFLYGVRVSSYRGSYIGAHVLLNLINKMWLVLVQPRKSRPFITERLLMGHKESNQTNKTSWGKDIKFKACPAIYLFFCSE